MPGRLQNPDGFTIVREIMDSSTIAKKVEHGPACRCNSPLDFRDDARLVSSCWRISCCLTVAMV